MPTNIQKLIQANRALAQLGIEVRSVDDYVVEIIPLMSQKPIRITRMQLAALAQWYEADKA